MTGIATSAVILGAVYMLWMYQRVVFGPLTKPENADLPDLSPREIAVFAPVIFLIVLLGVFPQPVLARMGPSVELLVSQLEHKRDVSRQVGEGPARLMDGSAQAPSLAPLRVLGGAPRPQGVLARRGTP
jgi:NADH-quinone oxidoreductase subunit M